MKNKDVSSTAIYLSNHNTFKTNKVGLIFDIFTFGTHNNIKPVKVHCNVSLHIKQIKLFQLAVQLTVT